MLVAVIADDSNAAINIIALFVLINLSVTSIKKSGRLYMFYFIFNEKI